MDIEPRRDFIRKPTMIATASAFTFRLDELTLKLWTTCVLQEDSGSAHATVNLKEGEQLWAVLTVGNAEEPWSASILERRLEDTVVYWRNWLDGLTYTGLRGDRVRRSALTIHLLSYAPTGSMVAAPTTSLPERLGSDRNYDYRYAWVRDASLSLAVLALLGDTKAAKAYMDWLAELDSSTDSPLQVVYGISGNTDLTERARDDLAGYQGSRPVRFGNHAFSQRQLDSLGYFVDCAFIYLQQGGEWRDEYWDLTCRIADYTAKNWTWPDSGIWELTAERHYVSSRVMSWVVFDRAIKMAEQLGHRETLGDWRAAKEAIQTQLMTQGWSDRLSAFRQSYEDDRLDASVLLIPVMGFLPADHPRVVSTVQRIEESLTIDGFVYRFRSPGAEEAALPLGDFEGAFLPCTFWLATTYAMAGRADEAEAILNRAETYAGALGLFAEEVDPRSGSFLGNSPLLFAHVEYIRAVMELAKARPLDHARLLLGKVKQWLGQRLFGQERRLRKEA
ncbi:MAG: glycoside hydrolase family 15 protein [Nitrospira sp.]|nr:glycoside hydrolase family 15 protein [Nitrospira sp.]